jgi:hypothetical protein
MEQRLSLRIPLMINVAIYYKGLGLLRGRSLDVSRHGMFVATGPMLLPIHSKVEVVFTLERGKGGPLERTTATVVRLNRDGIGLMFSNEIDVSPLQPFNHHEQQIYLRSVDATSG